MAEMHLVIGGARSGKSRCAERLAEQHPPVLYLATAEALDSEMQLRIRLHRERRPADWQTIEVPCDLADVLREHSETPGTLLVECVTLWISNLLLKQQIRDRDRLIRTVEQAVQAGQNAQARVVWVTNEVGAGIVPENPLARDFRDLLGEVNQMLSEASDQVHLCVAGISISLK